MCLVLSLLRNIWLPPIVVFISEKVNENLSISEKGVSVWKQLGKIQWKYLEDI